MTLHPNIVRQYAKLIRTEIISQNDRSEEKILNWIYRLLSDFHSKRWFEKKFYDSDEFQECRKKISKRVFSVKKSLEREMDHLNIRHTSEWFSIGFKNLKEPKSEKILGLFKIDHKDYFTLDLTDDPSYDKIYDIMDRLCEMIQLLAKRFYKLSRIKQDNIYLKIQYDLPSLLSNPHSLVVHYSIRKNALLINKLVMTYAGLKKVKFRKRKKMPERGFDVTYLKGNKYEYSHSNLISFILTQIILERPEWVVKQTDNGLAEWMEKMILEISFMKIHDLHKKYHKYFP